MLLFDHLVTHMLLFAVDFLSCKRRIPRFELGPSETTVGVLTFKVDAWSTTVDAGRTIVDARRTIVDARRTIVDARRTIVDARRTTVDARRTIVDAQSIKSFSRNFNKCSGLALDHPGFRESGCAHLRIWVGSQFWLSLLGMARPGNGSIRLSSKVTIVPATSLSTDFDPPGHWLVNYLIPQIRALPGSWQSPQGGIGCLVWSVWLGPIL